MVTMQNTLKQVVACQGKCGNNYSFLSYQNRISEKAFQSKANCPHADECNSYTRAEKIGTSLVEEGLKRTSLNTSGDQVDKFDQGWGVIIGKKLVGEGEGPPSE